MKEESRDPTTNCTLGACEASRGDNLRSSPRSVFQSLSNTSVTNSSFGPPHTSPSSPSSLLPVTYLPPLPSLHSLCLTSFLFISVSNSLLLPLSIRPSVSSTGLPLAPPLNLLSTDQGVSIWQDIFFLFIYFFIFEIVSKNKNI